MGLITERVVVKWHQRYRPHYEKCGYNFTNYGDSFYADVQDLTNGSNIKINYICDKCAKEDSRMWIKHLKSSEKHSGRTYCTPCLIEMNSRLEKKTSYNFEKWCTKNNKSELLDLWDFEKNDFLPDEVSYASERKAYFKCKRGLHKSELNNIFRFYRGSDYKCSECNSFGQWLIDNLGLDSIDDYWSIKNDVSPYSISVGSSTSKTWINCTHESTHESYLVRPSDFTRGDRCPKCSSSRGEKDIKSFLTSLDFDFERNYRYKDCKNEKPLPFDFAVMNSDLDVMSLIEYDGQQHFKPVRFGGISTDEATEKFNAQKLNDSIKNQYCKDNNIPLLRIPYWEKDNIAELIKGYFINL